MGDEAPERAGNDWVRAAAFTSRGPRPRNEDVHLLLCDWLQKAQQQDGSLGNNPHDAALFAVLDGHGGSAVSRFAARHLAEELQEEMDAWGWEEEEARTGGIECAFLGMDRRLRKSFSAQAVNACGSTCVAALVWPLSESDCNSNSGSLKVAIANLGDSRGLVVRRQEECSLELLGETEDHKPSLPRETARVQAAGGSVTAGGPWQGPARVDGILAVSRAFGDFLLKGNSALAPERQKVSAVPDITEINCKAGDLIVLASDGVFDVLSSAEVAKLVCQTLREADLCDVHAAARAVVQEATLRKTLDNATCVVVELVLAAQDEDSLASTCPDTQPNASIDSISWKDTQVVASIESIEVEDTQTVASMEHTQIVASLEVPPIVAATTAIDEHEVCLAAPTDGADSSRISPESRNCMPVVVQDLEETVASIESSSPHEASSTEP